MENWRKYLAEFLGTFTLVFLGCGTAMLVGCDSEAGGGYILTAFAFGLAIVALAYSVGNISGGHVNPAVSLGFLITKQMSVADFVGYVIAQIFGALFGSGALALIFRLGDVEDMTGGFGTNGLAGVNDSVIAGLLVEIFLTCIFVLCILGVTSPKRKHGSFGGLIIGLTLVGVHILGIGLTGTSVNPARSLGPAIVAAFAGNVDPLKVFYVFLIGPLVGAAIAAGLFLCLEGPLKKANDRPVRRSGNAPTRKPVEAAPKKVKKEAAEEEE